MGIRIITDRKFNIICVEECDCGEADIRELVKFLAEKLIECYKKDRPVSTIQYSKVSNNCKRQEKAGVVLQKPQSENQSMKQKTERPDKLAYTKEEAAEQLGIGLTKLYEIIKRGDIKVKKEGRRVIIPRTSLEKYLEVE